MPVDGGDLLGLTPSLRAPVNEITEDLLDECGPRYLGTGEPIEGPDQVFGYVHHVQMKTPASLWASSSAPAVAAQMVKCPESTSHAAPSPRRAPAFPDAHPGGRLHEQRTVRVITVAILHM